MTVKELTVQELKLKLDGNDKIQLIDVREPNEREICSIGGELIPLGKIPESLEQISGDMDVIVYCKSGGRSGRAVEFIQEKLSIENVYNLKGGILAWAREIDPNMRTY